MRKVKRFKNPAISKKEELNAFDIWLLFPEGIIAVLFLLAAPIQVIVLFMHNRVVSGIFLMACAAASIYSSFKLIEHKKTYLAFCVLYFYVAISVLIGAS